MKIPRSEAVDKSPGVFFDAEFDFNGPGTPGAIKQTKKPNFWKNPKITKNSGPGRTGPDQAGPVT